MCFSFLSDRADFLDRFDGVLHEFSIVFDGLVSSLEKGLENKEEEMILPFRIQGRRRR